MRSRNTFIAAILIGAVAFAVSHTLFGAGEDAPDAGAKWANLQVVSHGNGLIGFFDKSTGRLYLYGPDSRSPYMITEIQNLGEPLRVIRPAPN